MSFSGFSSATNFAANNIFGLLMVKVIIRHSQALPFNWEIYNYIPFQTKFERHFFLLTILLWKKKLLYQTPLNQLSCLGRDYFSDEKQQFKKIKIVGNVQKILCTLDTEPYLVRTPFMTTLCCLSPVVMARTDSFGFCTPTFQTRGVVYITLSEQISLTSACSLSLIFFTSILTGVPWLGKPPRYD